MQLDRFARTLGMAFAGSVMMLAVVAFPTMAEKPVSAYALNIDGLACPFCAYGVEKKLLALHGVESIDIDINRGVVTVILTDGVTLDESVARKAVAEAGFTLRGFQPLKKKLGNRR